ncbi:hypothetical protein ACN2XU_13025 [Primorskyibacter sp. 2E107]|uniref:hypothetical protein n=1 Tax=Primorskyibacter sp. 2E107 TaxID=3403458 RepID=UPI003AF793E6
MLTKSLRPKARPDTLAAKAKALADNPVVSEGDTPAEVQKIATTETSLPGTEPMVLGVFGKESAQTALIRLPNGVVSKVSVGSRIGAQQVIAVATDTVTLTNSTRLRMPI